MNSKALFEYERSVWLMHWQSNRQCEDGFQVTLCNAEMHNTAMVSSSSSPHQRHHHIQIIKAPPPSPYQSRYCRFKPALKHLLKSRPIFAKILNISLTHTYAHCECIACSYNSDQTILECCQCILLLVFINLWVHK